MKKIITLMLVLAIVLTFTACKKDPMPPETVPPTAPVEEYTRPVDVPEVTPDLDEIATMPAIIPDDMPGEELAEIYKDFVQTYDWSQYNGFTSEGSDSHFTCIWTSNAEIYDTKRLTAEYEGAIIARMTNYSCDNKNICFMMTDSGSFVTTSFYEDSLQFNREWDIVNDSTISEYTETVVSDKIYDVISFKTTWTTGGKLPDRFAYTGYVVQDNATDAIFALRYIDGVWTTKAAWAQNYAPEDIQFDTETYIITLPDKTIETSLVEIEEPDEDLMEDVVETVLEGEFFVNRNTKQIEYMKDKTRNTTVTFLTNATIDFEVPENVREGVPEDMHKINSISSNFMSDVNNYTNKKAQ